MAHAAGGRHGWLFRPSTGVAGATSRPTGAATGACGSSSCCSLQPVCRVRSPTTSRSSPTTRARCCFPVLVDYPESKFGGFLAVTDYKDPVILDEIEQHGWAIWPPIGYSYIRSTRTIRASRTPSGQCLGFPGPPPWSTSANSVRSAAPITSARYHGDRQPQLARHRRPGPRRAGPPDLRLPHLGAVRAAADHPVLHHRRDGRRRAGLFRRPRRPRLPALPRDLVVDPLAVRAHHHLLRAGAGLLDAARRAAAVPLGLSGRRGARRVPARAQFRVHHRGAGAGPFRTPRSCSSICCRMPWWRR